VGVISGFNASKFKHGVNHSSVLSVAHCDFRPWFF